MSSVTRYILDVESGELIDRWAEVGKTDQHRRYDGSMAQQLEDILAELVEIGKAKDGDGDGMVHDGTPKERPARPDEMKGAGAAKKLKGKLKGKKRSKPSGSKRKSGEKPKADKPDMDKPDKPDAPKAERQWPEGVGDSKENPIYTTSASEALEAMAAGKHVEMDKHTFSMSLDKLGKMVKEAKDAGDDPPDINLCLAHVADTNIFCEENLGIPRKEMPQVKGERVRKGSKADRKWKAQKQAAVDAGRDPGEVKEVDATDEFIEFLGEQGIEIDTGPLDANGNPEGVPHPASQLKATQNQLVGKKVVGMMESGRDPEMSWAPNKSAIFISRDGFVLDGHHRWAATVGMDYIEDEEGGDLDIPVQIIDAPIQELVDLTNQFVDEFGILPKDMETSSPDAGVTMPRSGTGGVGKSDPPCIGCDKRKLGPDFKYRFLLSSHR